MHDSKNGKITSVYITNDERFVYSCGFDGNIFVFEMGRVQDHLMTLIISHSLKHEDFMVCI